MKRLTDAFPQPTRGTLAALAMLMALCIALFSGPDPDPAATLLLALTIGFAFVSYLGYLAHAAEGRQWGRVLICLWFVPYIAFFVDDRQGASAVVIWVTGWVMTLVLLTFGLILLWRRR